METSLVGFFVALLVLAVCRTLFGKHEVKSPQKDDTDSKVQAKEPPRGPFSKSEVAKHNTEEDAWIIIDGKVYDVTEYIDEHPGGDAIMRKLGEDNSVGFKGDHHPPTVWEVIPMYYIGDLKQ